MTTIKLSDYILEQSISDASVSDIRREQLIAEMEVCFALFDAYNKQMVMESNKDTITSGLAELSDTISGKVAKSYRDETSLVKSILLSAAFITIKVIKQIIANTAAVLNPAELKRYTKQLEEIKKYAEDNHELKLKTAAKKARVSLGHALIDIKESTKTALAFMNVLIPFVKTNPSAEERTNAYKKALQEQSELKDAESPYVNKFIDYIEDDNDISVVIKDLNTITSLIESTEMVDLKSKVDSLPNEVILKARLESNFSYLKPSEITELVNAFRRASNAIVKQNADITKYMAEFKKAMIEVAPNKKYVTGTKK